MLVDLTDAIAEELRRPFNELSMEMVYRGLYHYTQAVKRGETTDVVGYLAHPQQADLGIVKQKRVKKPPKLPDKTLTFILEP